MICLHISSQKNAPLYDWDEQYSHDHVVIVCQICNTSLCI